MKEETEKAETEEQRDLLMGLAVLVAQADAAWHSPAVALEALLTPARSRLLLSC